MNDSYNIFWGREASLLEWLDGAFAAMASTNFEAEAIRIPSLFEDKHLRTMGYYDNFRGHLSRVQPVEASHKSDQPNGCGCGDFSLIPAACIPVYPNMKQILEGRDRVALTSRVNVYRFEEGRRTPGTRTWEFLVREIIFVGTPDYVDECLSTMETLILAQASPHFSQDPKG